MVLNLILFLIDTENICKHFLSLNKTQPFLKHLYLFLGKNNSSFFRIKRKILGIFIMAFYFDDQIIFNYFNKILACFGNNKFDSNLIPKLLEMLTKKQSALINSIITLPTPSLLEEFSKDKEGSIIKKLYIFYVFLNSKYATNFGNENEYTALFEFFGRNAGYTKEGIKGTLKAIKRAYKRNV